jgi:hypothetical protein
VNNSSVGGRRRPAGLWICGRGLCGRFENGGVPELFHRPLVSGEGLQRGPVHVLSTLLHGAAHGLAHVRQVRQPPPRPPSQSAINIESGDDEEG